MSASSQEFSLDEMIKTHKSTKKLNVGWYCWLLTEHPLLIMFLSFVVVFAFGSVAFVYTSFPDFSEPSKGFEIRGSRLANKLVTWNKLINETGYSLPFSNYPYQYFQKKSSTNQKEVVKNSSRSKRFEQELAIKQLSLNSSALVFCDNPNHNYASWSFKLESTEIRSLWSVEGLLAMCSAEQSLLRGPSYKDVFCPSMTLPNYVARLAGVPSCSDLTKSAFDRIDSVLHHCAAFYCDGRLKRHCGDSEVGCSEVPKKCKHENNAVYAMFHYLFEANTICPCSLNQSVTRINAFIPIFKSQRSLASLYYSNFNKNSGPISVYSIDFGIDEEIFRDHLAADSVYPAVAMLVVSLILLLYTKSFFIVLMSFLSTAGAMVASYFLYKVLFDFKFFPFMNLAAVLVMVGLSADSVLLFSGAWTDSLRSVSSSKASLPSPHLGAAMKMAMRRVSWSLFATSATTAAAFFASYASHVTAIKCFSVYTGLTVLANLFLALTWLPASSVIHHKYISRVALKCNCLPCCHLLQSFHKIYLKVCRSFSEYSRIFFDQLQVLIIVRLRYFWTLLCFIVAVGASCVVFVYPRFRLPTGQTNFHYFKSSHPFERSRELRFAFQNDSQPHLPVLFVFGIDPVDTGDPRNPSDTGSVQFQRHFDVSHPDSQRWLLELCRRMRNFSYYAPSPQGWMRREHADCFMEGLKLWMESRDCSDDTVCCSGQQFPYRRRVFEHCLKEAIFQIHLRPGVRLLPRTPGPRFSPRDVIRAAVIGFQTNLTLLASYQQVEAFYDRAKSYFDPLLESAPPGLKNGWFVSELDFFAVQRGLYSGTMSSMGWSILVALLVILATSRSLAISLFASVTIGCIICTTVASLVLLGWQLDILESVTVSIAVGLSVDYTAHYAIAYLRAKPREDRFRRVELTVSRTGPAISLAALTTLIAGLGLLPASVLIYYKFGAFLVLNTASSWLLSSYLFLPLLSIAGPQGGYCDSPLCCKQSENHDPSNSITMTETSTFTPSSHQEVAERLAPR